MVLSGLNVVVTGANRGMGLEFARAVARRGASVIAVARSWDEKPDWFSQGASSNHRLLEADLDKEASVRSLADKLNEIPVDILINNAGLLTGGLLEKQSEQEILSMMRVNLLHLILLTRLVLPGLLSRKRGKIVNNASVSGKMFFPLASTYAASKAGVVAFTESLKQELRGTGVSTLLLITPGVKTRMYDQISDKYGSHMDLQFLEAVPAEIWAERVADAIESDLETLLPSGTTRWGLRMATHVQGLFEALVAQRFKR